MEANTFDAIITDPPYASGGATRSEREMPTSVKYSGTKKRNPFPDFEGDAKDQRSWTSWTAEWLSECRRVCKSGAPCVIFIDWRQLPSLTDAMQWAGWIWRGTAIWDKVSSRPQRGRFRQQAEFIVWGSNGAMAVDRPVPPLKGVFSYANISPNARHHQTEKPVELMRELVRICEPNGRILDPFAGSGSTLVAAEVEGYEAVGIEMSEVYAQIARERMQDVGY